MGIPTLQSLCLPSFGISDNAVRELIQSLPILNTIEPETGQRQFQMRKAERKDVLTASRKEVATAAQFNGSHPSKVSGFGARPKFSRTEEELELAGQEDFVSTSLKIVNARIVGAPFEPGDPVRIRYEIENISDNELMIPMSSVGKLRPYAKSGSRQHWLRRLGPDPKIPTMSPRTSRQGAWYASGGGSINTDGSLAPGEKISCSETIKTKGFPVGKYQYRIDFKTTKDRKVVVHDSVEIEFVLNSNE